MVVPSFAVLLLLGPAQPYVDVSAAWVAPGKGTPAAISVVLQPRDPAVHVNEAPGPRLKLDAAQTVLVDKQPPAPKNVVYDPDTAKYLDPAIPVLFPVALADGAPRGVHGVKATVSYFYCSKTEGWCRKGSTDVEVPVTVK
jgi:hypothetical protein